MITLNHRAPEFALQGVLGGEVRRYRLADFSGKWTLLFFYPADFSFICPTEIQGFQARFAEFKQAGCEILAVSTDSIESHREWAEELGGIAFPLLSDADGAVARSYGALNPEDGRCLRATFVLNPEGKVAHAAVNSVNVGRSVEETIRVVKALQSGRLCPADWRPGAPFADPGRAPERRASR